MTTETSTPAQIPDSTSAHGTAWAALFSAGIGCTAFGILTMLSECVPAMKNKGLNWYNPSGALSGVAIGAIVIWLIVWAVLGARWHNRRLENERSLMIATVVLVLVGILTTFPPFYELFGG